jgi:hypothetical protein
VVSREKEMCVYVCVDFIHIYIFTHLQDWEMWELCLFSMFLKVIELLLILSHSLLSVCENERMREWMRMRMRMRIKLRMRVKVRVRVSEWESERVNECVCVCVDYSYIYSLTIKIKFCESWIVAVGTVDCVVQFRVQGDMFSIVCGWVSGGVVQMKNNACVMRKRFETSDQAETKRGHQREDCRKCRQCQHVTLWLPQLVNNLLTAWCKTCNNWDY